MPDIVSNDHALLSVLVEQISALRGEVQAGNVVINKVFDDHENRLRVVEREQIRQGQQIGGWAGFQAVYATVTAAIAAWLGSRP